MQHVLKTAPWVHKDFSTFRTCSALCMTETHGSHLRQEASCAVTGSIQGLMNLCVLLCACVCVCVCVYGLVGVWSLSSLTWSQQDGNSMYHQRGTLSDTHTWTLKDHLQYKAQSKTYTVCELQGQTTACSCVGSSICVWTCTGTWCDNLHCLSGGVKGMVAVYFRLVKEKVILKSTLLFEMPCVNEKKYNWKCRLMPLCCG